MHGNKLAVYLIGIPDNNLPWLWTPYVFNLKYYYYYYFSGASGPGGMNREEAPGKSPEEMYIQQKVRVLLMLKKMGSNVSMSSNSFFHYFS